MFVTDAVLNKGTSVKEAQLLNILDIVVTDAVLNKGTSVKELQPLNIAFAEVNVPEDKFSSTFKLLQLKNKRLVNVILLLKIFTLSKDLNNIF